MAPNSCFLPLDYPVWKSIGRRESGETFRIGAAGGTRTRTAFRPGDFKSPVSAISPPRRLRFCWGFEGHPQRCGGRGYTFGPWIPQNTEAARYRTRGSSRNTPLFSDVGLERTDHSPDPLRMAPAMSVGNHWNQNHSVVGDTHQP